MTDLEQLTNEDLNRVTLQALGWRWEPREGKNAGGELITPAGTRYQFALNELAAWSIAAPQVVSDPCEALMMLHDYDWILRSYGASGHDIGLTRFSVTIHAMQHGIPWHIEGSSDTFPRAACKAVIAMLEAEKAVINE